MHPALNVAVQAIRKAGKFLIKQYELFNKKNIQQNYIRDFILKINKESSYIIETTVQKFYPSHTIITALNNHPTNTIKNKEKICWIIRSIDNDVNFIKQFPFFALSVAVQIKGHIEIEVIYDPIHNELFSACRGQGAQLNNYRIRVSNTKNLYKAIIAISHSYESQYNIINLLNRLRKKSIYFRCTGATILDLAYVAVGRVDGCISIFSANIGNNTLTSGALIIRESGGLIVDFAGTDNYFLSGNIIAGNIKIIRSILSMIKRPK